MMAGAKDYERHVTPVTHESLFTEPFGEGVRVVPAASSGPSHAALDQLFAARFTVRPESVAQLFGFGAH